MHSYLEDDSIIVDNDTALRLGCLEMRRFFRDMSQSALKKKENINMLESVVDSFILIDYSIIGRSMGLRSFSRRVSFCQHVAR